MNCISAAGTGFCTKWCTSDEQTPRPPSLAHQKRFRPSHRCISFAIPLALRCRRVWLSNLSTQLRRTQGLNTEPLTMPAAVADPKRSLDSEQVSPATIAHHTVYEKTPNLHQSHICQWGAQPYMVGPLPRLVGKPPFSPWLSKNVSPLTKAANGPNSAILLTEIFDRILFYVCNSLFWGTKSKKRGSRNNRVYRNLKPRRYEIFSVYDNYSLSRPYRVDVQNVSMRSFFSLNIFSSRIRLSLFVAVSSHAFLSFPPLNREFCKHM